MPSWRSGRSIQLSIPLMSSRKTKIVMALLALVLIAGGLAWRFPGAAQETGQTSLVHGVPQTAFTGGSSLNPMFSAPHTVPGRARQISLDQPLNAALTAFRQCKAPYYDSTLQAEQTIKALGRRRIRELIPDLMNILKENPDCVVGVAHLISLFRNRPPLNKEPGALEDAATLMPFLGDNDVKIRLLAANGISQMLANEAPPEVLHMVLEGLASGRIGIVDRSLTILWNMVSDGSGHPLPLDPARFGEDIQSVRSALANVPILASFEHVHATAANLIPWVKDGGAAQ